MALQCHDVLHICSDTRLLPTEPLTQDQALRLPKDQLPRRVLVRVRTDVSVRSEEQSRAVPKSSVALAPPLCYRDAGNNCGQMVLNAGQLRASTRLSADAPGFLKYHWEVDGPVHKWLSETPVLNLPHVFQALLEQLADVVRHNTHKHD